MYKTMSDIQLLQGAGLICATLLLPTAWGTPSTADKERDKLENEADLDVRVTVNDSTLQAVLDILDGISTGTATTTAQDRLDSELDGATPGPTSGQPSPSAPGSTAGAGNAGATAAARQDQGQGNAPTGSGSPQGNAPTGSGSPRVTINSPIGRIPRLPDVGARIPTTPSIPSSIDVPVGNGGQRVGVDGQGRVSASTDRVGVSVGDGSVSIDIPTIIDDLFPVFTPPSPDEQPPGDGPQGSGGPPGDGSPPGSGGPQGDDGITSAQQGLDDILGSLDEQLGDFARQGRGGTGGGQDDAEATPEQIASVPGGGGPDGQDGYYDPSGPQASEQVASRRREVDGARQKAPDYSIGGGAPKASDTPAGGTRPRDIEQVPPDLRDVSNDDIVARQLREAAIAEQDPELKEKLWEEYRKYKNI